MNPKFFQMLKKNLRDYPTLLFQMNLGNIKNGESRIWQYLLDLSLFKEVVSFFLINSFNFLDFKNY